MVVSEAKYLRKHGYVSRKRRRGPWHSHGLAESYSPYSFAYKMGLAMQHNVSRLGPLTKMWKNVGGKRTLRPRARHFRNVLSDGYEIAKKSNPGYLRSGRSNAAIKFRNQLRDYYRKHMRGVGLYY